MESCYFTVTKPSSSSSTILNFQGISSLGRRSSQKSLGAPSHLSWPSSRPNKKHQDFAYRWTSQNLGLKTFKGAILAEAGKQGWDFGRFIKTLYFFNGPPSPAKFFESLIEKLTGPSPSKPVNSMDSSGITLVTGATGGVGRRVVDVLRNKRLPVRVLVRNEEKARRMLGEDVDLVVGDVTKASTLLPEYFKGVTSVINAVSVIVGPKEGDTPDRAKYSQGIKFFEPEIKGDSPEMVEYIGMKNLINAVKENVGLRSGKLLFGYEGNSFKEIPWGALDDVVMGGVTPIAPTVGLTARAAYDGPSWGFRSPVVTKNRLLEMVTGGVPRAVVAYTARRDCRPRGVKKISTLESPTGLLMGRRRLHGPLRVPFKGWGLGLETLPVPTGRGSSNGPSRPPFDLAAEIFSALSLQCFALLT